MKFLIAAWVFFVSCLIVIGVIPESQIIKAKEVLYYADDEGVNVQALENIPFTSINEKKIPVSHELVWLKIPIPPEAVNWEKNQMVLFTGSNEMLASMDTYYVDQNNFLHVGSCEPTLKSDLCELADLQYAYKVPTTIQAAIGPHFLVKVETGRIKINNEFYFMKRSFFNRIQIFLTYYLGFTNGVSLLVAGLGLMCFISIRKKSFLYFSLFGFATFLSTSVNRGMWDLLKPNDNWITAGKIFLPIFFIAKIIEIYFIKYFFEDEIPFRNVRRGINTLIVFHVILLFMCIFPSGQVLLWSHYNNIVLLVHAALFGTLLFLSFHNVPRAKYLTVAWSIGLLSYIFLVLYRYELLDFSWLLGYMPMLARPIQMFVLGYVAFEKLQNVTQELAVAQVELRQTQLVKLLLRSISHDLSNTTNVIGLHAELAQTMAPEDSRIQNSISEILMASRAQEDIISSAKRLAAEQDRRLDLSEVSLVECAKDSISLFQSKAMQKNIVIELRADSDFLILGNKTCLTHQIIGNLIDNAIKFSHENSKVTVRVYKSADQKATVEISDNGVGIPEHLKPYVFNNGNLVSRKGTKGEPSTGLGLLIVRDYVEMLGGKITFNSNENQGTTFTMRFSEKS
jgi:signal transduction histidine kinase